MAALMHLCLDANVLCYHNKSLGTVKVKVSEMYEINKNFDTSEYLIYSYIGFGDISQPLIETNFSNQMFCSIYI